MWIVSLLEIRCVRMMQPGLLSFYSFTEIDIYATILIFLNNSIETTKQCDLICTHS